MSYNKPKKHETLFYDRDTNQDVELSLKEFRKIIPIKPKLREKANTSNIYRLETNADGFVSREKFHAARPTLPQLPDRSYQPRD
ncbi:MAG: hypothetical protein RMI91_06150 [Gemmatales bacterium]|nr:hypothetical protein [Gemmatales bacterium]MDW7994217.1 hypothetical protein [Gemmatales bacterium]